MPRIGDAGRSALVVRLEDEELALAPHAGKRASMDRTGAVPVERRQMIGGPVALVAGEAILGELLVRLEHQPIAGDLGHDRRRGDGGAPGVAVDDVPLRTRQSRDGHEVRDHELRRDGQSGDGLRHRALRGLEDVHAVDGDVIDDADADRDRTLVDGGEELLAALGAQELGISQTSDAASGIEDDRRRHDGPGERPAAGLVEAGHAGHAGAPRLTLVAVRRRWGRRHARWAVYSVVVVEAVVAGTTFTRFSRSRAALPASARR